jgi:hypothetical protein
MLFYFQVSLITVVYLVIVFYVSSNIASPTLTLRTCKYKPPALTVPRSHAPPRPVISHGSGQNFKTIKLPRKEILVSQMPNNKVLTTKGRNKVKRPSSKSPTDFMYNDDTPVLFPYNNPSSRNGHVENTNAWFDGEGLEQRMLLPSGRSIPEEMYGPNYIWDTKGWPRLKNTTPEPIYNHLKGSTRNKVSYDSTIIFQDNSSLPLHFPTINHLQTNKQNEYQNKLIEEQPKSTFEADGTERRTLLPKRHKIPPKELEPVYIWDNKGWPRFEATTPKPTRQDINTSRKSNSKKSLILFP